MGNTASGERIFYRARMDRHPCIHPLVVHIPTSKCCSCGIQFPRHHSPSRSRKGHGVASAATTHIQDPVSDSHRLVDHALGKAPGRERRPPEVIEVGEPGRLAPPAPSIVPSAPRHRWQTDPRGKTDLNLELVSTNIEAMQTMTGQRRPAAPILEPSAPSSR